MPPPGPISTNSARIPSFRSAGRATSPSAPTGFLLMRELGLINKLPRIAVAQAAAADPLYLGYQQDFAEGPTPVIAGPTLATAIRIGNPVSDPRAVRTLQKIAGVVEQATEDELAQAAARGDLAGLFCD